MGVELLIFGNKGGDEMFLKKRFELKERAFLKGRILHMKLF